MVDDRETRELDREARGSSGPEEAKGGTKKKSLIRDTIETLLIALALALLIRTFLLQPFYVPSSSMMPNIHGGVSVGGVKTNDFLFATKFNYGWRIPKAVHFKGLKPWFDFSKRRILQFDSPQRGEIIIFEYPREPWTDFVKRVVGVPGDRVEIRLNVVYVNGRPLPRKLIGQYTYADQSDPLDITNCNLYEETNNGVTYEVIQRVENGREMKSNFGPIDVPPGNYFVMGDNRDNSKDSRVWKFVPFERVKGKPLFIYWPVSRWSVF